MLRIHPTPIVGVGALRNCLMEKVLTVVLRYGTDATLPKELLQAKTDGTEVGGCKVIAASFDDEIARVEQFEEKEFDIRI